jgi:hypothetical protein
MTLKVIIDGEVREGFIEGEALNFAGDKAITYYGAE